MKKISFVLLGILLISTCVLETLVSTAYSYGSTGYYVINGEVTIVEGCYDEDVTFVKIPSEIDGYPVTAIGDSVFDHCHNLVYIEIPDTVTSIGDYAFRFTSLTSIIIPDSVTSIGDYAFSSTDLEDITLSNQLRSIGQGAFSYAKLTSVSIPAEVAYIGDYAFNHCDSLTSVTLPKRLQRIGKGVFTNCFDLTSITMYDTTTCIGDYAFNGCSSLDTIYYYGNEESFASIVIEGYDNHDFEVADVIFCEDSPSSPNVHEHSYGEWENDDAINHKKICECGKVETEEHTWNEGEITTPPTSTATGVKTYTCTKCSGTKTEVLDKVQVSGCLKINDITGKAGENVKVTLDISNNPGILGMILKISYDEALTLTAIESSAGEDGSALGSLDFTAGKDLTANPINVAWDGLDADSTNGRILNMYFTIPEDAENDDTYSVQISYEIGDVYDNDYNDIDLSITNGNITVKNYMTGDVSGDGIINMKDVTMLRRGVIGGYGITLDEAADVNHDGLTNMKDVTMLRRYVVGGYGVTLK